MAVDVLPNGGRPARVPPDHVAQARPRSQQSSGATRQRCRPQQQEQAPLGSEVKRLINNRSGGAATSSVASLDGAAVDAPNGGEAMRPYPRSRAAAAALANAASEQTPAEESFDKPTNSDDILAAPTAAARRALVDARQLHREGRDEEAVDILVEWLDGPSPSPHDVEMQELIQAMVALGCWLCNTLATRHLHARHVARAFGYTTTCDRWLELRQASPDDAGSEEMWARLRYDRAFNAAELAQSSGDRPKAIGLLLECERLQGVLPSFPDPEAAHLCLAQVLLESGRHAEAATAAVRSTQLLRKQAFDVEEQKADKIYGLLFAIKLEQAALASIATAAGSGPPPLRALRCLADAESAWAQSKPSGDEGNEAAEALLMEMRAVHARLLQKASKAHNAAHNAARTRPGCQSEPRLGGVQAEKTVNMSAPDLHKLLLSLPQRKRNQEKQKTPMGSPAKKNMKESLASLELRETRRLKGLARHKELQEDMKRLQQQMRQSCKESCNGLGINGAMWFLDEQPQNTKPKKAKPPPSSAGAGATLDADSADTLRAGFRQSALVTRQEEAERDGSAARERQAASLAAEACV